MENKFDLDLKKDQSLYMLINDLAKNLYIKHFQQCFDFNKGEICGIIGIDICRTIDKKFKLFHTIIATAIAYCFYSIEIPYAIVVFCDYGVQFVIKDFEDPHQEDISQLIFDSIMVPRCSTRIADACYFISQKVNCKGKPNKKVFIISNGLDTKLKIGEKWEPIFSNEKEKFCFYFVKPDLEENDFKEIIEIWKDFKEKTKTEISIITLEDILNPNISTFASFRNVMQTKNVKDIESKKFKKTDFINLLNSINTQINKSNEYFIQNRIHIPSKGKYKLDEFVIKNPFLSLKGECYDEDYNLEQIDNDSRLALEKLFTNPIASEMKLEYIEFIFPSNKPSMYSPSTKGTRLYLMGLSIFVLLMGKIIKYG